MSSSPNAPTIKSKYVVSFFADPLAPFLLRHHLEARCKARMVQESNHRILYLNHPSDSTFIVNMINLNFPRGKASGWDPIPSAKDRMALRTGCTATIR